MKVFGTLDDSVSRLLSTLTSESDGLKVRRLAKARSSTPFPKSTELELALEPILKAKGFAHHVNLRHPRLPVGFEYDFWREADGVAIEVMGYRADDEIYKDILKFHVHSGTHTGIVLVPRWKWISGKRSETNTRAALKALAFADSFMNVRALIALAYDWEECGEEHVWRLRYCALDNGPG